MESELFRRVVDIAELATGEGTLCPEDFRGTHAADLDGIYSVLTERLPRGFSVTGTHEERLFVAETGTADRWVVGNLDGRPLSSRSWPAWMRSHVTLDDPDSWTSVATLTEGGVRRLLRPEILLVALYHKETFPLPRFPLAISDLARAARATCSGRVRLMDMQLGVGLDQVKAAVSGRRPDIVGVSATFGQHDLMIELLDHLSLIETSPIVLSGGSLTARNEGLLLDLYPRMLVARGAGEPTIADVIAYFHDDVTLAEVRGIGYHGAPRGGGLSISPQPRRTATVANRDQTDILPELDLLDRTFDFRGVAQLETSRGCTNYCSFCPRGHKGIWSGTSHERLPWLLRAVGQAFDRHPELSRTLYLVDEEFIGRDFDAADRALQISSTIHEAGFRWESSCRIDQVVDPARSADWHVERIWMWRSLVGNGLRRMLFGVESGVTSVLDRFNKETTGEQNALAIRTLSALGVPTRFTYITFDHLMDLNELEETHAFQARTDLLLRPRPDLPAEEIVAGVRDPDFVRANSLDLPLHSAISYMLVSMECLIGAAYTRRVQAAGLAGPAHPAMGKFDADFADWRIGRASHHAQLWVDRNFALDYTLKSLEKILDGPAYTAVRKLRQVVKSGAFSVLTEMISTIEKHSLDDPRRDALDTALSRVLDREFDELTRKVGRAVTDVLGVLRTDAAGSLRDEYTRWLDRTSWQLINEMASC